MTITDWISAISSVASAIAALIALYIAIALPIHQKKVIDAEKKRIENEKLESMKEIAIGYFYKKLNESLIAINEPYGINSTQEYAKNIFKTDSEFKNWLNSILLNVPTEKPRTIIIESLDFLSEMNKVKSNIITSDLNSPKNKKLRDITSRHESVINSL